MFDGNASRPPGRLIVWPDGASVRVWLPTICNCWCVSPMAIAARTSAVNQFAELAERRPARHERIGGEERPENPVGELGRGRLERVLAAGQKENPAVEAHVVFVVQPVGQTDPEAVPEGLAQVARVEQD